MNNRSPAARSFRHKLIVRLEKLGWAALLGAIPAGLLAATTRLISDLIQANMLGNDCNAPSSPWGDGFQHPLHLAVQIGILLVRDLPLSLYRLFGDLVNDPTLAKQTISSGTYMWRYSSFTTPIEGIIVWCIAGTILGILILSWSKHPLRRFLKINAMLLFILLCVVLIFFAKRLPWFKSQAPVPRRPAAYERPVTKVPQGYKREEVVWRENRRTDTGGKQSSENNTGRDWLFKGEVLSTCTSDSIEYRLIYNFIRIENIPWESFEYYGTDKVCPWVYSLWTKKERDHTWRLLGPFLPGLGFKDFPAFDASAGINFAKGGDLRWVVRERETKGADWRPAHLRLAKDGGKAWVCSFPLELYTRDSDKDGLSDIEEAALLTDPNRADTEGDGIVDGLDASPHGWFKDTRSGADLAGRALDNIFRTPNLRVGMGAFFHLDLLKCSRLRPHLDLPEETVLTLNNGEEAVFRNRNGAGTLGLICRFRFSEPRTFLFGLFGLLYYEELCGGLEARGYLVLFRRTFKREWKPFAFEMWMIS